MSYNVLGLERESVGIVCYHSTESEPVEKRISWVVCTFGFEETWDTVKEWVEYMEFRQKNFLRGDDLDEPLKFWINNLINRYGLEKVKAAIKEFEDKYKDGEKT